MNVFFPPGRKVRIPVAFLPADRRSGGEHLAIDALVGWQFESDRLRSKLTRAFDDAQHGWVAFREGDNSQFTGQRFGDPGEGLAQHWTEIQRAGDGGADALDRAELDDPALGIGVERGPFRCDARLVADRL